MPSIIQKARDAVMAVSIGMFSSDHASASDAPDTSREPEAEPFVFQSQDTRNKALYLSEDKGADSKGRELDWSVTRFLPPEPPLDERDCSLLSKHFQTTYCLQQENDAALIDEKGKLILPQGRENDDPLFNAFDCDGFEFSKAPVNDIEEPTEAWRCLGNFNFMSGENWSVKGAASVRQDTTDITNSKRFGICPEGDANCLGWGIQVEIKFDP